MTIIHKIFVWFLSAVLLLVVVEAAYRENFLLLFLPAGLLAILLLLQYPEYLLYVLVISIPWSVAFQFNEHLGTDLPDEPLMLLMSLAACILLICQRKKEQTRVHPLIFILLAQLVWTLLTVIASTNFLVSLKYLLAKCWYLLAFVAAPLYLFREKKIIKRSAVLLLSSMLLCMVVVLIRQANNHWSFEKINDALYPFYLNHVNYSALLVFMIPLLIACIRLSGLKAVRILCRCLLLITVAALYFSYSRGSWLALFTGLLSYWLIRRKVLFAAFVLFFSFCLAAIIWLGANDRFLSFSNRDYKSTIFHKNFREHLAATYQMKDASTAERLYRWVAGVRMIRESWPIGFGPTSFYEHYKGYALPAFKTWVSRNEEHSTVHNYFLLMIIEQGAMGLFLFLTLLGALFWNTQRLYHQTTDPFWKAVLACASALLMMECTVNFLSDMIETDKAGSVFYLCVAVIVSASRFINQAKSTSA